MKCSKKSKPITLKLNKWFSTKYRTLCSEYGSKPILILFLLSLFLLSKTHEIHIKFSEDKNIHNFCTLSEYKNAQSHSKHVLVDKTRPHSFKKNLFSIRSTRTKPAIPSRSSFEKRLLSLKQNLTKIHLAVSDGTSRGRWQPMIMF